jgi:hypothetical protein
MSDEKITIYISPEEDLTSVRERLEQLPAHYITLVIPTETQLRSHVAWKLLRARVRELGKEVQIISDSAQVRSVARDVNFKVASSLEASPTGKSRPPSSRAGRGLTGRSRPTGSIQRPAGRRSTGLRGPESAYPQEPANQWLPTSDHAFEQQAPEQAMLEDDDISHDASPSSAPAFDNDFPMTPEVGQNYGFHHIDTSPPIRPLPPQYLEEDPDLWSEDFREAQIIRESASRSDVSVPEMEEQEDNFDISDESASSENKFLKESAQPYRMTPLPNLGDDPIDSMDDALPPPPMRREQRGAAPALDNFETQEHAIQDVPDIPTDVFHGTIEDDGDQGDFVIHSDTPPAHQLREPIAEDEQDRADDLPSVTDQPTRMIPQVPPVQPAASGTSRPSKQLPPQESRRSGKLPSMPLARRSGGLPPAPSRVSGAITPQNMRASGGLQNPATRASGNLPQNPATRASGNLPQNPVRSGTVAPEQPRQGSKQLRPGAIPNTRAGGSSQLSTTGRNRAILSRPGTRPGRGASPSRQGSPARTNVKRTPQRRNPVALVSALIAVIVIVALVLLYWLLPTATITVTLPAQNYSAAVKLVAGPGSQANVAAGIGVVQETTLNKDFTTSGTGNATGTTKIGTATAHGTVLFTNNSNQQITVPSGVLLSTSNGTQFTTEDNIALGPKNSVLSSQPSFIDAQVSGDSGNVPTGSITIIPASTMKLIEQSNTNVLPSAINLQVTNDQPTSGGGVGSAITITQKDLDNTQAALNSQLQNSVNAWVQKQLSTGDVAGKPVITPTLTSAPKVNAIEQDKTFSAALKESVEVAIVRSAALQTATITQLNTALGQDKNLQNYQIVPDTQQSVQIPQFTPVSNGLSLTLNFKPTGKIVPKFDKSTVQARIVNQSPTEAETTLKSLIPGIQNIQVTLVPSFLPLTPLRPGNIHIQFVAATGTPAKK